MNETSRSLILRYEPGQFSFSRIDREANATQLLALANAINEFQEAPAKQVVLQTRSLLVG